MSYSCDDLETIDKSHLSIKIDKHLLRVEIANTQHLRSKGLMHRTKLGIDEGMIFIFPNSRKVSFWMKNTLIPLDIAYFTSHGRLVEVMTMVPDDGVKSYPSSEKILYAIETNAGWFQQHKIEQGAILYLPRKISAY